MKLSEEWQKGVEQKVKQLFSKVLGGNEKYVYYIYIKTKRTFWLTQYLGTEQFVWLSLLWYLLYCAGMPIPVLVCQGMPIYIKSQVENFILSALQDVLLFSSRW